MIADLSRLQAAKIALWDQASKRILRPELESRAMETFHLAGPLRKKVGGGHKFLATWECSLGDSSSG